MNQDSNQTPDFAAVLAAELGQPPADGATNQSTSTSTDGNSDGVQAEQPSKAVTEGEQQVTPAEGEQPGKGEPASPQDGEDDKKTEKTDEEKAAEAEAEKVKNETTEETAARHAQEAAEKSAAEEPKFATKDDVRDALHEYQKETSERISRVNEAKQGIISKVHPEGIDQKIYDSNGNVIKTAQDIVDRGLINEATHEPFTYEEAASFMLQAQQKTAENIKELETWAEGIAEKNINLMESNARVMAKWGETLSKLPKETVEKLAETYITKQVRFDDTGSYVTDVAMSPEDFYDTVMAPYSELNAALAAKAQLEEATQQQEQAAEQQERNGIPPQRGTSSVKANTGDPMLDALVDELNKK